ALGAVHAGRGARRRSGRRGLGGLRCFGLALLERRRFARGALLQLPGAQDVLLVLGRVGLFLLQLVQLELRLRDAVGDLVLSLRVLELRLVQALAGLLVGDPRVGGARLGSRVLGRGVGIPGRDLVREQRVAIVVGRDLTLDVDLLLSEPLVLGLLVEDRDLLI